MASEDRTSSSSSEDVLKVAIIGGGITGSVAAHVLLSSGNKNSVVCVDLFDQGRRGVGGRSSDRQVLNDDGNGHNNNNNKMMRWDHGCQFFRADTERFQRLVNDWISQNIVEEWIGDFRTTRDTTTNNDTTTGCERPDFFGLPSLPPFYIGVNGMQSICKGILENLLSTNQSDTKNNTNINKNKLSVLTGTRVSHMERDEETQTWKLWGMTGPTAFHDTPKEQMQQAPSTDQLLGHGYNVILLTDVSSSFGKWHRASAGVPESFAKRVRERVGSRVPLFTAMIAFDNSTNDNNNNNNNTQLPPFDAATFHNDETLWFAAKTNSKLNGNHTHKLLECWTLVSTPDYAMKQIEQTPMQDPKTAEFIPQSKDYLTNVPAPDLIRAFTKQLTSPDGILAQQYLSSLPKIIHVDAQRWGSALPSHKHLSSHSTKKHISGVSYESITSPLAPTQHHQNASNNERNFLIDKEMKILQAGDMMSTLTPGFEAASLSGMDAADFILHHFMPS